MEKIVFFNQKGGTGKTVSTVNIASCLEKELKKKVMVIDCDPQINCTLYLLSQYEKEIKNDIISCIKGKTSIRESVIQSEIPFRLGKTKELNIYVIPGSRQIDTYNIKNIKTLDKLLEEVKDEYDYCLFDCPPHLNNMTLSALATTNYVVVPALADTDSLCGYDFLIDTINQIRESETNLSIKMLGIFFNNVEPNKALDKYIIEESLQHMSKSTFKTYIRRSSAISQARFYGKPINYYKPSNNTTKDYIQLTKEIIKKIEEESN